MNLNTKRWKLNKLFEKTYWIDEHTLFEFAGNYAWARQKWTERIEKEEVKQKEVPKIKVMNVKKKESNDVEEIEDKLMHIEEDIYALECTMEETSNIEILEQLYKGKTEKERLRAELYNRLDSMME